MADADPRRGLGRGHPGRTPDLDRRGGDARRPGRYAGGQGRLGRRGGRSHRRPGRVRRRQRARDRARPRPARALAPGPQGPGRRAHRGTARREAAVVRAAHVADLDGHRALHGDLGARPRRPRGARRRARGLDADPPRRPPRRTHPQLRLRHPRPAHASRGVPHRPRRPGRRRVVVGTRGRRPDGHRLGRRLLPAGDPAGAPPRHRPAAVGPDADRWLDIAQAFAGPPGEGRAAR